MHGVGSVHREKLCCFSRICRREASHKNTAVAALLIICSVRVVQTPEICFYLMRYWPHGSLNLAFRVCKCTNRNITAAEQQKAKSKKQRLCVDLTPL